jgi:subtilisin family serine protease
MKREYVVVSVKNLKSFRKGIKSSDSSVFTSINVETAEMDDKEKQRQELNKNNLAVIENFQFKSHLGEVDEEIEHESSWFFDFCNLADDYQWTGKGVKVGIIDSGIHLNNHVFGDGENPIKFRKKNFINGNDDVSDNTGHGTTCASVIFGRNYFDEGLRTVYRIGVAKGVTDAYIAKVSNTPHNYTVSNVVQALLWLASHNVDIVNMSFGITFTDYLNFYVRENNVDKYEISKAQWKFSQSIQSFNKILDIISKNTNITFIASSGNDSNRENSIYRSIFCGIPAIAKSCLSVGSLDYHEGSNTCTINHYSNAGVDYVGPNRAFALSKVGSNFELTTKTGTSIAAPYLTGFAALMIEKIRSENKGTFSKRKLIRLIDAQCDHLNFRINKTPLFGRGLPLITNT